MAEECVGGLGVAAGRGSGDGVQAVRGEQVNAVQQKSLVGSRAPRVTSSAAGGGGVAAARRSWRRFALPRLLPE